MTDKPINEHVKDRCGNCGAKVEGDTCPACGAVRVLCPLIDDDKLECALGAVEKMRGSWITWHEQHDMPAPQVLCTMLVALEAMMLLTRENLLQCLRIEEDSAAAEALDDMCTQRAVLRARRFESVTPEELAMMMRHDNPQA